jgi:glycerophosphoryl diester phosphodiesterase
MTKCLATTIGLLVAATTMFPSAVALAQAEATLEGRAVLPADTFADGPPSGKDLEEETKGGHTPPFEGQPAGGVSAVLEAGDGGFQAMPDNGFGKKGNSSDFELRTYHISPDFETAQGGSGEISIGVFVQLRDPDRQIPFVITNEDSEDRILTGADFDIESVRRDSAGGLWFGDEFGPFLLHTDATGRVLEAPIPLPDVKSPENPTLGAEEEPNLATSKGFEGMAISESGDTLYPMLEGALEDDQEESRRFIHEFDLADGRYTGEAWQYRTEESEHAIGDFTALDDNRFLVIERDNEQGEEAGFKKVYEVDLDRTDSEGYLIKEEALDLLRIRDPNLISEPAREGDLGLGDPFSFPFQTIESILPLGDGRLLLLNDNNYPLSAGRNPARPDDTEAIIVRTSASPSTGMPQTGGPPLVLLAGCTVLISGAGWAVLRQRVHAASIRRRR